MTINNREDLIQKVIEQTAIKRVYNEYKLRMYELEKTLRTLDEEIWNFVRSEEFRKTMLPNDVVINELFAGLNKENV